MSIISAGDAQVCSPYLNSETVVYYGLYEFVGNKSQMTNREKCLSLMILLPCWLQGTKDRNESVLVFLSNWTTSKQIVKTEEQGMTIRNVERQKVICWKGRCNSNP